MRSVFFGGLLSAICLINETAVAAPFLPAGVTPGSPYHLVFITRDPRDGVSSNIADYNTFVNDQAALNPVLTGNNVGVTYFAIGSTTTVDANANAVVSAPVYNFFGQKVADSFVDMWDGSLDTAVRYDQFVNSGFPDLYTGTEAAGLGFAGSELGTANPRAGLGNLATSDWVTNATTPQASAYAFYGLSEVIIAPASTTVPEPNAATIWLLLGLGMIVRKRLNARPTN
jgi:hypothetical protein